MKRSIFLGTFLMIFTIGLSQSGAKIEFLNNDNTIDYGNADNGIRSFEFQNTGDIHY